MGRMSVATIDSPEFISITSISPSISKCEIKVMYVGENRNHSYISKEVATKIAQTIPGVPIVGYWLDSKEDFSDHGERIVIDAEGVKFNDMTKPFGFVAPDAKVWFQKFEDTDEFGNKEIREYLMTEGYLWTSQYEECKKIFADEKGNPQSMKLFDDDSLKGYWSTDKNKGIDFFIINDAQIENLCILGNDVEPCFEGSDITQPKVSAKFTKTNEFVTTLFSMMEELKDALNNNKEGGTPMEKDTELENEVIQTVDTVDEAPVAEAVEENAAVADENTVIENAEVEVEAEPAAEETEFAKEEEDKKEEDKPSDDKEEEEDKKKEDYACKDDDEKKKYELLENEYNELKNNYDALVEEVNSLKEFKLAVDNEKKDNLIASFYMLSDEDKKDVIENKTSYTLDEIEAKLSVICVRKKVNFDLEDNDEIETKVENTTTYNLNASEAENIPAFISALRRNREKEENC